MLLIGLYSILMPGCLLPPPLEEDVGEENRPPRVLIDSLIPHPSQGPVSLALNCPPSSFAAGVTDPDATDTLYWRVFINYHRDDSAVSTEVRTIEFDPGRLDASQSIEFQIDPQDERFTKGGGTSGVHTIELLISDRSFNSQGLFPPGRAIDDETGFVDSFVWAVTLEESADSCDEEAGQ